MGFGRESLVAARRGKLAPGSLLLAFRNPRPQRTRQSRENIFSREAISHLRKFSETPDVIVRLVLENP